MGRRWTSSSTPCCCGARAQTFLPPGRTVSLSLPDASPLPASCSLVTLFHLLLQCPHSPEISQVSDLCLCCAASEQRPPLVCRRVTPTCCFFFGSKTRASRTRAAEIARNACAENLANASEMETAQSNFDGASKTRLAIASLLVHFQNCIRKGCDRGRTRNIVLAHVCTLAIAIGANTGTSSNA